MKENSAKRFSFDKEHVLSSYLNSIRRLAITINNLITIKLHSFDVSTSNRHNNLKFQNFVLRALN